MGILNDNNCLGVNDSIPKTMSECKPDYESMIKRAEEKKQKAQRFKDAIFDFLEARRIPDALVVVVGELDFEIFGFEKTIERLIEQQERALGK